ncbi:MAG: type II secretion system F family protein [Planctomycetota bacterium]
MSVWRYTAIARDAGSVHRGAMAGADALDVRTRLRRQGLEPLDVRRQRDPIGRMGQRLAPTLRACQRRSRSRRRSELFESLAGLLAVGTPLDGALRLLASSSGSDRDTRRGAVLLEESVRGGRSFAEAMERAPGWFDRAEIAAIRAAERTGRLEPCLDRLAERLRRRSVLTSRIVGAFVYPAVVSVVGVGVVVFLSTHTLPQLAAVIQDAGSESPWLTNAVIAAGQILLRWGWLIVLMLLIGSLLAPWWGAALGRWRPCRVAVRRLAQLGAFRTPLTASLARELATLLHSGVTLAHALAAAGPTVRGLGSADVRRGLTDAVERLQQGEPLSAALSRSACFDAEFRQLIALGEESGTLPELLDRYAERAQDRAERAVDRLARLIEPAAVLLLAALVGVVVMAAVLPMIRLQETVL